ncbi:pancreatic triacylglycerol lipase-like [Hyposmocoma kahamanoa]|uniref:pancreatic triacylglycerol lipase-like n=1 Tax=Hyposmocoma kahamanoa TaxID=1477025 RepID=UPI000E6D807F|nr:pancreatic triacylglycerol lipase-like [Hyposmocoma kahamanoa]
MKFLVAFALLITLCAALPANLVPGDNSHYVEGESRYIWMSDGDGVPHLVDLHAPVDHSVLNSRNGANNQYWLFTRNNRNNHQLLIHNDGNSVRNSHYSGNRPLKVVVHGWNSNGNSDSSVIVRDAFLDVSDCNVIVVDWRGLANGLYTTAVNGVPGIGQHLGDFLNWLISNHGGNWNNVHLVGFSLGSHVVGNAGRQSGRRASRITGLDPAGPQWGNNGNALNGNDGIYVEAIHTDGGLLGIYDPIGNSNFYPNGGRNPQPGCSISTCSHGRANEFFASTIRTNHLVGRQCSSLTEVANNQCTGSSLNMGNAILTKRGSGLYRVNTGSSWPF